VAKDTRKPTTTESDLDRETKKALCIEYEVGRYRWLTGQAPMTPPGGWVPMAPAPVIALVPLEGFVSSKTWVDGEARRMKLAGEIPAHTTTKTAFAKTLANRMQKAATANPSIRPIQWRSIRNQLESWGLWPASKHGEA
jgi:hypothetical protein